LVIISASIIGLAFFSRNAVGITGAFDTPLFTGRTSREKVTTAVRIIQAFYALFFGQRTSFGSSRAVGIRFASVREDASGIGAAFSSAGFSSSPVSKRAVGIASTFDTATSFNVAIRSAVIIAVIIVSTEIYTDVGKRIAVLLVCVFTTILISTGISCSSARIATSISTAVRNGSGAISIDGARSASSISLAFGLSRRLASIENSTIGVVNTSLARLIGLTVVSASVGGTASVISAVGNTLVRVYTTSVSANGVGAEAGRSVVSNAVSIAGASRATTVFMTVLVGGTVAVCSTGIHTEF